MEAGSPCNAVAKKPSKPWTLFRRHIRLLADPQRIDFGLATRNIMNDTKLQGTQSVAFRVGEQSRNGAEPVPYRRWHPKTKV